jgi:formate dehydrogenase alpha subunit
MTNSIAEIEDTACLFIIGSNTTEAHPLIAHRMFHAKKNGAKIVVVDPRRVQMSLLADMHIRIQYGTDVVFLNAMMHEIVDKGYHNSTFIEERTEGFETLMEILPDYSPEKASKICGIHPDIIREAAKIYATSEPSTICYTLGITEHSHGVDNVKSLANLAMLTGHIGKPSSGVNPLRGQNNVQGACDMGGLPNVFPGYQVVTSEVVRDKFKSAWNVQDDLPANIGKTIPEMLDGLSDGSMKSLYIVGEDSVVSDPDTNHIVHALKSAQFLVVQDIFLTPTAQLADVVLPAACYAETDGTFTCSERKVQRVRKAVEPPGEARPDWMIISELSRRLGYEMNYNHPEEIFNEMASLTPIYGGISYHRLEKGDLQWPCPTSEHPGTTYLHRGTFGRGLGLFSPIKYRPSEELPDAEYPFFLTTGRRYAHYNVRSMTGRCKNLDLEMGNPLTQIHFKDAEKLGVREGDPIKIVSRRGVVVSHASLGDIVPEGSIFMDFHFDEANSNLLLGTSLDPITKTPDYKVCAVRVESV